MDEGHSFRDTKRQEHSINDRKSRTQQETKRGGQLSAHPNSEMSADWRGCLADMEHLLNFLKCRPIVLLLRCIYTGAWGPAWGVACGCVWGWMASAQGEPLPSDIPCTQQPQILVSCVVLNLLRL